MRNTQVVILMGGLGTRLGLKDYPKSMADVHGLPFFEYQLKILRRWGFKKYLFLVGYQSEKIFTYFGNGERWDITIDYSYDGEKQLGTGGAIVNAYDRLEDYFFLLYGDSFMDIDFQESLYRYMLAVASGTKLGLMTIFENHGKLDKSNVKLFEDRSILYDKHAPTADMEYIDYGISIFSKKIFRDTFHGKPIDLSDIVHELSAQGRIEGQIVSNRFYEIGSPKSLDEFRRYVKERFYEEHNAIFLDRDGVINELFFNDDTEQLDSPFRKEDFVYKKGIVELLRMLQQKGFWLFIVTNQPAAAKGKVSLKALYDLNTWLIQDLKAKGVQIQFVGLCPHYGSMIRDTEAKFLIGSCSCRKPGTALITDLISVYNIKKARSFMIGDSYTDILAGKAAGLKTILLGSMKCDMCMRLKDCKPDFIAEHINEILKGVETNV